ncbi:MAG: nucleoside 2-deoxyribosyltransferase [Candidatus Hodarchaeota archaeon]
MSVYICSPIKLSELNKSITKALQSHKISVYLPEFHTNQNASPDRIFKSNVEAIRNTTIVVAVLKDYGRDFGFEIGYAYGLGKKIIGYAEDDCYEADTMIRGAIDIVAPTIDLLIARIKDLLR